MLNKYNIETIQVSGNKIQDSNCAAITFINKGGTSDIVYIDNLPLAFGQSLSIEETDVTDQCVHEFNIKFDTANTNNRLFVLKKSYL